MRIALIADTFPPLRTSGAIQLRDLSREFARQGHQLTVMLPSASLATPWLIEDLDGVEVLRLRAPKTKDISYVNRTFNEFIMPFVMLENLRSSPLASERWDGVVWYSPSIFLGPIAKALKKTSGCKAYLIIRDIFPEWAVDMGLMGRGLPYKFFKFIANYQYSVANMIGIQAQGNQVYFADRSSHKIEVLQNWLANALDVGCSIKVSDGQLAGRTIFVYAGNMGIAQGMDVLLALAERMSSRSDIGFLFVGRGSDVQRLRKDALGRGLNNVAFHDEIDSTEIPGLYAQCHIGIVALDLRHKTHNIPGKFLSYMQAGLPVLAIINEGNDLENMIVHEQVGKVCTNHSLDTLEALTLTLASETANSNAASTRCKELSTKLFSPEVAVKQIVSALKVVTVNYF